MKMILFYLFSSLFYAVTISRLMVITDNPFNLTLRGRRVAFVFLLILGFAIGVFVSHWYVDCDLRAGATTPCVAGWH